MKAINAFLLIALIYVIGSADAQIRCLDYVPNFKGSYVAERSSKVKNIILNIKNKKINI